MFQGILPAAKWSVRLSKLNRNSYLIFCRSIRAWRALRLDEKFAKKLERKERKIREEAVKKANIGPKPSSNPFSSSGSNPFSVRKILMYTYAFLTSMRSDGIYWWFWLWGRDNGLWK
jgi:hypothetical protein